MIVIKESFIRFLLLVIITSFSGRIEDTRVLTKVKATLKMFGFGSCSDSASVEVSSEEC